MTDQEFATAIRGLTAKQLDALSQVALGNDGFFPQTLAMLARRGLIEPYGETLTGRFPVKITRYLMPIHVHICWCKWAAIKYPPPELAGREAGA